MGPGAGFANWPQYPPGGWQNYSNFFQFQAFNKYLKFQTRPKKAVKLINDIRLVCWRPDSS